MLSMLQSLENVSEYTIYIEYTKRTHIFLQYSITHAKFKNIHQYYTLAIEIVQKNETYR